MEHGKFTLTWLTQLMQKSVQTITLGAWPFYLYLQSLACTILTVYITQATLWPTKTNYYIDAIGKSALIENSCMCHFETDELT